MWFRESVSVSAPAERRDVIRVRGWLEDQLEDLNVAVKQSVALSGRQSRSRSVSPGAAATRRGVTDTEKSAHDGGGSGGKGTAHSTATHGYSSVAVPRAVTEGRQLLDSIADAIVIVRDDAGFLETTVLAHQEEILTQAQEELCVQVGGDVIYVPLS